jgi:hypothetical protein
VIKDWRRSYLEDKDHLISCSRQGEEVESAIL